MLPPKLFRLLVKKPCIYSRYLFISDWNGDGKDHFWGQAEIDFYMDYDENKAWDLANRIKLFVSSNFSVRKFKDKRK